MAILWPELARAGPHILSLESYCNYGMFVWCFPLEAKTKYEVKVNFEI